MRAATPPGWPPPKQCWQSTAHTHARAPPRPDEHPTGCRIRQCRRTQSGGRLGGLATPGEITSALGGEPPTTSPQTYSNQLPTNAEERGGSAHGVPCLGQSPIPSRTPATKRRAGRRQVSTKTQTHTRQLRETDPATSRPRPSRFSVLENVHTKILDNVRHFPRVHRACPAQGRGQQGTKRIPIQQPTPRFILLYAGGQEPNRSVNREQACRG